MKTWVEQPLDAGEQSLSAIADWGPAEDWSGWADATGAKQPPATATVGKDL